jgi:hypothetical protein
MYAKSPALPPASSPPLSMAEEVAAFVRLPIDVFCKIIGTQPRMDGMRKSTKYLTMYEGTGEKRARRTNLHPSLATPRAITPKYLFF